VFLKFKSLAFLLNFRGKIIEKAAEDSFLNFCSGYYCIGEKTVSLLSTESKGFARSVSFNKIKVI